MLYSVDCSKCSFLRDTVIFFEFWYSVLEISVKITIPILPKFTVNDSSFLLMLLGISINNSWNKSFFNIMIKIIEKNVSGITKCGRSLLQGPSCIIKCDRLLLQRASGITKCDRLLLQNALGIYKV